jgi:hypothetical protein
MVLDQKQTPVKYVPKRQVIDGQQRLTTVQIFLAAFRDFCRENKCDELASECEKYTLNVGMMADPDTERFKVWPTQLDRPLFADVMTLGSRFAVERKYPLTRRKHARKPDPRPRIVECYLFFHQQIFEFFRGTSSEPALCADRPLIERLDDCLQALTFAIHVVTIDLDPTDDAQIIFETLNARGEPLLPADLLRNFIFLRASRAGEKAEVLYERYWRDFDDSFWRHEIRQGRLVRPRSDLFMQHFLSSQRLTDIPVKHLYVEYKYWIDKFKPFATATEELSTLAQQRDDFRRFLEPRKGDVVAPLARFLDLFDVGTAYPLLMAFARSSPSDEAWSRLSQVLESFLLRRSVCGWTTKAYNRVFLGAIKSSKDAVTAESVASYFLAGKGESVEWPSDEEFRNRWMTVHAYQTLTNGRIVHILKRISDSIVNAKSEQVTVDGPLSVEHLLPQSWTDHWPLKDGQKGASALERFKLPDGDHVKEASLRRDRALQRFGNLTILTKPLNSSVSNGPWKAKRPEILKYGLLPINQMLHRWDSWDEDTIRERGEELFAHALKSWPRL